MAPPPPPPPEPPDSWVTTRCSTPTAAPVTVAVFGVEPNFRVYEARQLTGAITASRTTPRIRTWPHGFRARRPAARLGWYSSESWIRTSTTWLTARRVTVTLSLNEGRLPREPAPPSDKCRLLRSADAGQQSLALGRHRPSSRTRATAPKDGPVPKQALRDSNPHQPVLETGALAIRPRA